jgi:hypothetical protein
MLNKIKIMNLWFVCDKKNKEIINMKNHAKQLQEQ